MQRAHGSLRPSMPYCSPPRRAVCFVDLGPWNTFPEFRPPVRRGPHFPELNQVPERRYLASELTPAVRLIDGCTLMCCTFIGWHGSFGTCRRFSIHRKISQGLSQRGCGTRPPRKQGSVLKFCCCCNSDRPLLCCTAYVRCRALLAHKLS